VRANVEKPVMTSPTKKRINTELFIDEMTGLDTGELGSAK